MSNTDSYFKFEVGDECKLASDEKIREYHEFIEDNNIHKNWVLSEELIQELRDEAKLTIRSRMLGQVIEHQQYLFDVNGKTVRLVQFLLEPYE